MRFVSAQNVVRILYRNAAVFEDGTLNFLSSGPSRQGLDFLDAVGLERITARVAELTEMLLRELRGLAHEGGAPLVRVYGPATLEVRGGTIAFNPLDSRRCGHRLPAASDANISLRGQFLQPRRC